MASQGSPTKALNISLWIAQAILAFMFLWAGFMKAFQSVEQMSEIMA